MAATGPVDPRDRVEAVLLGAALTSKSASAEESDELIADLAAAESLGLTLADRLRAAVGTSVVLSLATQDQAAARLRGTLEQVEPDHVLVRVDFGLVLVSLQAIVAINGLGPGSRPMPASTVRWTWRATLRRWLGQEVVVYLSTPGNVRGHLERVAADHIDVAGAAGRATISWQHVVAVFNHHASDLESVELLT